jgi:diaminopropionate ammonia-lyase
MNLFENPHLGRGLSAVPEAEVIADPAEALALFSQCPVAQQTDLVNRTDLAEEMGIGSLWLKDERNRLGLGSFKALGAAHAIARQAAMRGGEDLSRALDGETFVCASAGNHGLSVAAGGAAFGARAVVYLAETVPEGFAERLRAKGAQVVREGIEYEASMTAAMKAADDNGWQLLSDSTWTGYSEPAVRVMEGYLIMAAEVAEQISSPPSHIYLQAGVGGLAAACTVAARRYWGDGPRIIVVEPEAAPALHDSIRAGKAVVSEGPVSAMGRLDCKEPSQVALACLAREADAFMLISEDECNETVRWLAENELTSTPSGVAGIAGARLAAAAGHMAKDASVLAYLTEAADG